MKIIHISDTHLGASGFGHKVSPSGLNQREEDICNSFSFAIDKILEINPDVVLHCGDLFHSVRPSNRILNFAIREILRLTDKNIPVVLISGNHDTPKLKTLGSVFSLFEFFPNIYPVYKSQYEKIKIKDATIHALPHCLDTQTLKEELAKIKINAASKFNVLMLHGVVAGIKEFSMGEIAEQEIPSQYFEMGFDYVALGHYHAFTQVKKMVYYSGSTERLSFNEKEQEKGLAEIDLKKKKVKFHFLSTRAMTELPSIDATSLTQEKLLEKIENQISKADIKDKIVRIKILNIPSFLYNNISFKRINELKASAFYFEIRWERLDEKKVLEAAETAIGKLEQEFSDYLKQMNTENLSREKLLNLGLKYLTEKKEIEA
jgi:exonuclease SbcD